MLRGIIPGGNFYQIGLMSGRAGLLVSFYLDMYRGIVSHIYLVIIYITIHNAHLWVPLYERNNVNIYKLFTFIITIIFYLYNTINVIHKCTLNCKDLHLNSSSSSLSNLVQFSSCILLFLSFLVLYLN